MKNPLTYEVLEGNLKSSEKSNCFNHFKLNKKYLKKTSIMLLFKHYKYFVIR